MKTVVLGIKIGIDHSKLFEVAQEVVPPPAELHLVSFVVVGAGEDQKARMAEAERALDKMAHPLREKGYKAQTRVGFVAASAGLQVVRVAKDHEADLIVIGMAKRTRVGKALLGSDAQSVMMNAPCPVLSMRIG